MLPSEPSAYQVDKATETLYNLGRHIWRGHGNNMLPYIGTSLGVMVGDIQRQSQKLFNGRRPDFAGVGNDLAGIALHSLRWIGDLDLNPMQCVRVAAGVQRRYADDH